MFLGVSMFGPSLAHLNPRFALAKMSLSRAKNILTHANINSIVILTINIEHNISQVIKNGNDADLARL